MLGRVTIDLLTWAFLSQLVFQVGDRNIIERPGCRELGIGLDLCIFLYFRLKDQYLIIICRFNTDVPC